MVSKQEQKCTESIRVEVLGVGAWKNLVRSALNRLGPLLDLPLCSTDQCNVISLRGDTIHVLAELVQGNMIRALEVAQYFSVEQARSGHNYT
jgi:hypothetical protein